MVMVRTLQFVEVYRVVQHILSTGPGTKHSIYPYSAQNDQYGNGDGDGDGDGIPRGKFHNVSRTNNVNVTVP